MYIMTDTRVNSDWAKTKIVTFLSKIINSMSKSVSKTTFTRGGFIRVNGETIKIFPYSSVAFGRNPEKKQSKRTDLNKTNPEKKVDKVLPGKRTCEANAAGENGSFIFTVCVK